MNRGAGAGGNAPAITLQSGCPGKVNAVCDEHRVTMPWRSRVCYFDEDEHPVTGMEMPCVGASRSTVALYASDNPS